VSKKGLERYAQMENPQRILAMKEITKRMTMTGGDTAKDNGER